MWRPVLCEGKGVDEPQGENADSAPAQEEGQEARPLVRPHQPTPEMIAAHEISHVPYRNWCRACVAGRGRAYSHRPSTQTSSTPVVSMDYLYFNEPSSGSSLPTLVLRDGMSKAIFSHLLPAKGTQASAYPERAVLKDLHFLGYRRVILKHDQEPAIKALARAVKAGFEREVVPEESPKGDAHGQSNGAAERAVQTCQGLVRTLKAHLEEKLGREIGSSSSILAWMVEHAGTLRTLYSQEGAEGLTPFQRIKGRKWQIALPCFGEVVDYRKRTQDKLEGRWNEGIFLGVRLTSSEKIIGTENGIFVVQGIRRKPDGNQYNADLLQKTKGISWKPMPDGAGQGDSDRLPSPLVIAPQVMEGLPHPPPGQTESSAPYRRLYIRQADLELHGCTGGCEACAAIREGRSRSGILHSEHCRKRLVEALKATSAGQLRLEREREKEELYIAKVIEEDDKKRKQDADEKRKEEGTEKRRATSLEAPQVATMPPPNPGGASSSSGRSTASVARPNKRKGDEADDCLRAENREQPRGSPRKRKAEEPEAMLERLLHAQRESFIGTLTSSRPTCDWEDGLSQEHVYQTFL